MASNRSDFTLSGGGMLWADSTAGTSPRMNEPDEPFTRMGPHEAGFGPTPPWQDLSQSVETHLLQLLRPRRGPTLQGPTRRVSVAPF